LVMRMRIGLKNKIHKMRMAAVVPHSDELAILAVRDDGMDIYIKVEATEVAELARAAVALCQTNGIEWRKLGK
jgi:hypothetical protein